MKSNLKAFLKVLDERRREKNPDEEIPLTYSVEKRKNDFSGTKETVVRIDSAETGFVFDEKDNLNFVYNWKE